MRFQKRLVVAFLIILIVPIMLFSAVAYGFIQYQEQTIREEYKQEEIVAFIETTGELMRGKGAELRVSMVQVIVSVAFIILFTAGVLVFWLYRSVVRPLDVLRMATQNMKEGNLDFEISGDPNDELGQLCEDFEEMRKHLKEQIDARMKYEQDTVELISNISHDLKTPLTAIKGYAEGIIDGVADSDEKREKYIKTIYTKASDMTVLVDELSFYSKIDSNIVPYNYKKIDINEYFTDCVDEQSLDMEVKNIVLTYDSEVTAGTEVVADPEQLRRVVNNVIGNSVKYMDKTEGMIKIILTEENEDFVRIAIGDNGAGIPEKDVAHVFDRFYRGDASRNTKKGGSGLGLAIAHKIIEDHGGRIHAESVKGEGTTIVFTLPKYKEGANVKSGEVEDAEYTAVPNRRHIWEKPKMKQAEKKEDTNGKNSDN